MSKSVVFFSASIPLALWPFVTIAQPRFKKGRKKSSAPKKSTWKPFPASGVSILWERNWECPWQVLPWVSLHSELLPKPEFHWGKAPAPPAEGQFPNCQAGWFVPEVIPSNARSGDSHSPLLHHGKGNSRSTVEVPAGCKTIQ